MVRILLPPAGSQVRTRPHGFGDLPLRFRRINSTYYSLNAMEIENARYDGEFKALADELAQAPIYAVRPWPKFQSSEILGPHVTLGHYQGLCADTSSISRELLGEGRPVGLSRRIMLRRRELLVLAGDQIIRQREARHRLEAGGPRISAREPENTIVRHPSVRLFWNPLNIKKEQADKYGDQDYGEDYSASNRQHSVFASNS